MAQARTATRGAGGEALIGSTARVRGRITGDGDLTIAGAVDGDITLQGDLTIAEGGSATSNVEARTVTIAGALEGDVHADGAVVLQAGARVRGNVQGTSFVLEDGASFSGRVDNDFDLPEGLGAPAPARSGARR